MKNNNNCRGILMNDDYTASVCFPEGKYRWNIPSIIERAVSQSGERSKQVQVRFDVVLHEGQIDDEASRGVKYSEIPRQLDEMPFTLFQPE